MTVLDPPGITGFQDTLSKCVIKMVGLSDETKYWDAERVLPCIAYHCDLIVRIPGDKWH